MSQIHVDLLTAAKKRIQSGRAKFICFAIRDFGCDGDDRALFPLFNEAWGEIDNYIRESLGEFADASAWLYSATGARNVPFVEWRANEHQAIQEWRCRWIDQMIEIFKDAK